MIVGKWINRRLFTRYKYDALALLRLSDAMLRAKGRLRRLLLKVRYYVIHNRYGCFIPPRLALPQSTVFPHGLYGIFISERAKIGAGCTIFQYVTIGSNTLADSAGGGAPVIGDNVYIGAGAKIIGNVHVGNNVRIGANAVVTKDVPDNATVVLPGVRVILHEASRDNRHIPINQYPQGLPQD